MSVNILSVYSSSTRAVSYEIELRNKHKMIKGAFWSTEESQIALHAPCEAWCVRLSEVPSYTQYALRLPQ